MRCTAEHAALDVACADVRAVDDSPLCIEHGKWFVGAVLSADGRGAQYQCRVV
jgi:hypothetical protein